MQTKSKRSPSSRLLEAATALLYQSIRVYIGHNRNESFTMDVSKLQSHCYVSTDGNNLIVPLSEPRKTDLVPGKLSGTTVFRFTTRAEPNIEINHVACMYNLNSFNFSEKIEVISKL